MVRFLLALTVRVAILLAFVGLGYSAGLSQGKSLNEEARKAGHEAGIAAGRMSACNELLGVMQKTGNANPNAACVVVNGQVVLGFPGHDDAPHFYLNGELF